MKFILMKLMNEIWIHHMSAELKDTCQIEQHIDYLACYTTINIRWFHYPTEDFKILILGRRTSSKAYINSHVTQKGNRMT